MLRQAETTIWELHLGGQGPSYLCHQLLPSEAYISRKLNLEAELRLEPRHSNMGGRHPN